jgi:hypothetical protein
VLLFPVASFFAIVTPPSMVTEEGGTGIAGTNHTDERLFERQSRQRSDVVWLNTANKLWLFVKIRDVVGLI